MGPASFDAIGISWLPLPFTAAPIENSPPGIQTMPFGALPGALVLLDSVGANAELPSCASSHCARAGLKLTTAIRVKMIRLTSVLDRCCDIFCGFHSFLISRAQI